MKPFAVAVQRGYRTWEVWSACRNPNGEVCLQGLHQKRGEFEDRADAERFARFLSEEVEG